MPPKKRIKSVPESGRIMSFFKRNSASEDANESEPPSDLTAEPSAELEDHVDSSDESGDNDASETKNAPSKFQPKWCTKYHWLIYDSERNLMFCKLCRDLKFSNTMGRGTSNFKTSTLSRHVKHRQHKLARLQPVESQNMGKAVDNIITREESAAIICFKAVQWLCTEDMPLSKYESLMTLLTDLNVPHIGALQYSDRIGYRSYDTACEILHAMSTVIDEKIEEKLRASPAITILTDESTDIVIHHKLVISCRIVDPITLAPSTLFLSDIHITDATGKGIFEAICDQLSKRKILPWQVNALGTDGASVMTGRKTGLCGQFLRHNPHIVNSHCAAHKVALISEQAAKKVPAMADYQKTLESLFYHFKKSPVKRDKLRAIQKVLDDPEICYREVHTVRWLSFYIVVDAVHRTLDSLLTYLKENEKDPVARGLQKKIGCDFFIAITYELMDILQPIMRLSLFFQRSNVDIGSVKVNSHMICDIVNSLVPERFE